MPAASTGSGPLLDAPTAALEAGYTQGRGGGSGDGIKFSIDPVANQGMVC